MAKTSTVTNKKVEPSVKSVELINQISGLIVNFNGEDARSDKHVKTFLKEVKRVIPDKLFVPEKLNPVNLRLLTDNGTSYLITSRKMDAILALANAFDLLTGEGVIEFETPKRDSVAIK